MITPFSEAITNLDFEQVLLHISQYAVSDFGKELLLACTPSTVLAEVRDELSRVREMMTLLETDDPPPIEVILDCRAPLHRAVIEASLIPSEDFRSIHVALVNSRRLRTFFARRTDRCVLLGALGEQLFEDKMLEFHIDRVINEEGQIKDSASKELRRIRSEIIDQTSHLRRKMEAILKRVSEEQFVMEELVTMRDGRMVLPVRSEYKRQVSGFIHSTSASGQTVYIEPTETLDLNNEIRDLQFAEIREVNRILTELTDKLRPCAASLLQGLAVYAELDSLYARARYAQAVLGCTPAIDPAGPLRIQQGRHPILLMHKKLQDVIPLDITIGETATTIVITGPNAGGKSVTMKAVGLFSLMAQSGIPIPCEATSTLPLYTDIFVDIGDEQSVENDLSTFSSHVKRLERIVEHSTSRSLVLIDEIGTGTDPSEGSALGASILEYLTTKRMHIIATTHHGFLKAFAHEHEGMENGAMEFDLSSLQPTYRFRLGLPGSSYAFEITQRHGMKQGIISRAREIMGTQTHALEDLLADFEKKSFEAEKALRQAEQLKQQYQTLSTDYEEKMAAIKRETQKLRKEALEEADRLISDANSTIENLVREIKEHNADRDTIKQSQRILVDARRTLAADREAVTSQMKKDGYSEPQIQKGSRVVLQANPGTVGEVIEELGSHQVMVAFGDIKMKVDLTSLRCVEEKGERIAVATQMHSVPDKNEIDLRGLYGDEAVSELDAFLYQAYLAGFKRIDVIHGKGTGALRKRVHDYLKDVSFVSNYQLAEWNEGGSGATRVIFKD